MLLRITMIQWLFSIAFVGARLVHVNETLLSDQPQSVIQDHTRKSVAKRGSYGDDLCAYHFNKPKTVHPPGRAPYDIVAEIWEERNSLCMGLAQLKMYTICIKVRDVNNFNAVGNVQSVEHQCPSGTRCYEYPADPTQPEMKYAFCMWEPDRHATVLHPGAHDSSDVRCTEQEIVSVGQNAPREPENRLVLLRAEATTSPISSVPLKVPEIHVEVSSTGAKGLYHRFSSSQWSSTTAVAYAATVATIFVRFCIILKPWQLSQYPRIGLTYSAVLASTVKKISDVPQEMDMKPVAAEINSETKT